jgi:hypothetical protein
MLPLRVYAPAVVWSVTVIGLLRAAPPSLEIPAEARPSVELHDRLPTLSTDDIRDRVFRHTELSGYLSLQLASGTSAADISNSILSQSCRRVTFSGWVRTVSELIGGVLKRRSPA